MLRPATRLVLIGAGGTLGTAARILIDIAIPNVSGFPFAVLVCNLLGSFLIGLLAVRIPETSGWRFFLGAGVLGGFTTYSAFAVGIVSASAASLPLAAALALATLFLGLGAAFAGMILGRKPQSARGGTA